MWLFKKELRWRTIQLILIILFIILSIIFNWDASLGSLIGVALVFTIMTLWDGFSKKRYLKCKEKYEEEHSEFSRDCRKKAAYYVFSVTLTAELLGFFILTALGEKDIAMILGCIYIVQVVLFEGLYAFFKWNDSW